MILFRNFHESKKTISGQNKNTITVSISLRLKYKIRLSFGLTRKNIPGTQKSLFFITKSRFYLFCLHFFQNKGRKMGKTLISLWRGACYIMCFQSKDSHLSSGLVHVDAEDAFHFNPCQMETMQRFKPAFYNKHDWLNMIQPTTVKRGFIIFINNNRTTIDLLQIMSNPLTHYIKG